MPTLPLIEEPPTRTERVVGAAKRIGAAVGADHRVTVRVMVFLALAVLGSSQAPFPWAQIALLAVLGIGLDIARTRRYDAVPMQGRGDSRE
jgi:hypothetical protein